MMIPEIKKRLLKRFEAIKKAFPVNDLLPQFGMSQKEYDNELLVILLSQIQPYNSSVATKDYLIETQS